MAPAPINSEITSWKCKACKSEGNPVAVTYCKNINCRKDRGQGDIAIGLDDCVVGEFVTQNTVEYNGNKAFVDDYAWGSTPY